MEDVFEVGRGADWRQRHQLGGQGKGMRQWQWREISEEESIELGDLMWTVEGKEAKRPELTAGFLTSVMG